jgi:hypothetical protein
METLRKYEFQEYQPHGVGALFDRAIQRLKSPDQDQLEALEILCKEFLDFAVSNMGRGELKLSSMTLKLKPLEDPYKSRYEMLVQEFTNMRQEFTKELSVYRQQH